MSAYGKHSATGLNERGDLFDRASLTDRFDLREQGFAAATVLCSILRDDILQEILSGRASTSSHGKLAHHARVFMFENMAVEHERCLAACGLVKSGEDLGLSGHQNGIFPAGVFGPRGRPVLCHHSEPHAMDMEGMGDH
jgi:hypothetical protein